MSQDPAFWAPEVFLTDPQQLNSYSYGRNNPLKFVDRDGKVIETVIDVGFLLYDTGNLVYQVGKSTYYLGAAGYGAIAGDQAIRDDNFANFMANDSNIVSATNDFLLSAAGTGIPGVPVAAIKGVKTISNVVDVSGDASKLTKLEKNVVSHGYDKHAVKQSEWGTPPISQTEYVEKVRDVQKNYDNKVRLQKDLPDGRTAGKTYYGNSKTGDVLIKNAQNKATPTFFRVLNQSIKDFLRNAIRDDIKIYKWRRK